MAGYLEALEEHREELDSLNVYPVPDGDTGTNLVLTQRAVVGGLDALPSGSEPGPDLRAVCDAIAGAALLAARGNAGVIMAQILRGICDVLVASDGDGGGAVLAAALGNAAGEAYRAVQDPQEGTALTVLREAAEAAEAAGAVEASSGAGREPSGGDVADAALSAARRSLATTRETLPALWRAGVVDAGGLGLVLLLDALRATLLGTDRIVGVGPRGPLGDDARVVPEGPGQGSEVQFVLSGTPEQAAGLRERLAGLGVSLAVGGGGGLHAFHVHTNDPARVLEAARAAGTISGGSVVPLGVAAVAGVVAVVEDRGVAATLLALGAVVVAVGPGHEPSPSELAEAIDGAPGSSGVVVLVDHAASLAAAERAAGNASKPARVVAAGSAPAGLAAATAHDPALDLAANVALMGDAAAACLVGEVREASSSFASPVGEVRAGHWMAIRGDVVVLVAADPATAALGLVADLGRTGPGADVLTLILGDGAEPATDPVVAALRRSHPELRLHPVAGGHAGSHYLIGVG